MLASELAEHLRVLVRKQLQRTVARVCLQSGTMTHDDKDGIRDEKGDEAMEEKGDSFSHMSISSMPCNLLWLFKAILLVCFYNKCIKHVLLCP